jgi:osmotically-inducible protein OsmY
MTAATIRRSDLDIHTDVVAELDWDARLDPGEVGVEVDDGVVTLRGTIATYPKLRAAADLAARVPGVRAVVNDLAVRAAEWYDDLSIASGARIALELDPDVPNERIECFVRDGRITLRGSVDHAYQRRAAEAAVARINGMRGLDLEIEVRGHTRGDAAIQDDVRDALRRRLPWASLVGVAVAEGTVTLSGRVPSLSDRLDAEETAWRGRGVRQVIDHIVVMGE